MQIYTLYGYDSVRMKKKQIESASSIIWSFSTVKDLKIFNKLGTEKMVHEKWLRCSGRDDNDALLKTQADSMEY